MDRDPTIVIFCAQASLGLLPKDEPPLSLDAPNHLSQAQHAANQFITAIRNSIGREPRGARLRIDRFTNKGTKTMEVICEYDAGILAAREYARRCAEDAPRTWTAAGMTDPISGNLHNRR